MKKVLIINGSPRTNGATSQVLAEIEKGLKKSGISCVDYQLNKLTFKGCQGCMGCKKLGYCCVHDDLSPVLQELKNADGIVIGTPIYMFAVSGQTKLFMDRLYSLIDHDYKPYSGTERKLLTVYSMGNLSENAYVNEQNRVKDAMKLVGLQETIRLSVPGNNVYEYPAKLSETLMRQAFTAGEKFSSTL